MFLTIHASIGALIGEYAPNAFWAFLMGFIAHFLLDLIPHGDQDLVKGYYKKEKVKRMVAIASIDAIVMISLILTLLNRGAFAHPSIVTWGVIGSILPDFLVGIHELSKNRFFKKFNQFHFFIHDTFTKKIRVSLTSGIIIQAIIWWILIVQIR